MSKPSAPYYYKKEGRDVYHWERSCHLNKYPAPGWTSSNTPPAGREQCNECKSK